jgi:hypothetical protein
MSTDPTLTYLNFTSCKRGECLLLSHCRKNTFLLHVAILRGNVLVVNSGTAVFG